MIRRTMATHSVRPRHIRFSSRLGIESTVGRDGELIHDYRRGLVPLIVPITLLGHHARYHGIDHLSRQIYLAPDSRELMLRNQV
jgi:uncharacterized protein YbgA (DUF1722 family)